MLVVIDRGQVLLEQRPGTGSGADCCRCRRSMGMWRWTTIPELDVSAAAEAAEKFGQVEETEALLPLQHVFTHYKLHIHPYRIALLARRNAGRLRVVGPGPDRRSRAAGAGQEAAGAAGSQPVPCSVDLKQTGL
jgi:adenine-specific DNA glycosylase